MSKNNRVYFPPIAASGLPNPEAAPFSCLRINSEWVPFLNAWFYPLFWKFMYYGASDEVDIAASYAALLPLLWDECGSGATIEQICNPEYTADQPPFSINPQNPFTQPDFIPLGYEKPPFWLGSDPPIVADWIGNLQPNDVVCDISLFEHLLGIEPFSILQWRHLVNTGFPRLTFHFSGSGTLEWHLLKIPLGGLAMLSVDGNISSAKFVDLATLDLSEAFDWSVLATILGGVITGSLITDEIVEMEVSGEGEHYATVTFLPNLKSFSDLVPFLYLLTAFGGGFRKIEWCGDILPVEINVSDRPQFRINAANGHLELRWYDEPWEDLGDVTGEDGECDNCGENIGYGEPEDPEFFTTAALKLAEIAYKDLADSLAEAGLAESDTLIFGRSFSSVLPAGSQERTTDFAGLDEMNPAIYTEFANIYSYTAKRANVISDVTCRLMEAIYMQDAGDVSVWGAGLVATLDPLMEVMEAVEWGVPEYTDAWVTEDPEYGKTGREAMGDIVMYHIGFWVASNPSQFLLIRNYLANLSAVDGAAEIDCNSIWEHTFDFTIDEQGWVARPYPDESNLPMATYIEGVGWSFADRHDSSPNSYWRFLQIRYDMPEEVTLIHVSTEGIFEWGEGGNAWGAFTNPGITSLVNWGAGNPATQEWDGARAAVTFVLIAANIDLNTTAAEDLTGSAILTSITLRVYADENPFE